MFELATKHVMSLSWNNMWASKSGRKRLEEEHLLLLRTKSSTPTVRLEAAADGFLRKYLL